MSPSQAIKILEERHEYLMDRVKVEERDGKRHFLIAECAALEIGYLAFGEAACTAAAREGIAAFGQNLQSGFGGQIVCRSHRVLLRLLRLGGFGREKAGNQQNGDQQMTEFHALSS